MTETPGPLGPAHPTAVDPTSPQSPTGVGPRGAPPEARDKPRLPLGVRAGPALAGALYAALLVAALVSLAGERMALVPAGVRALAPAAFGVFVVLFAAYRLAVVRARKASAFRSFVQVAVALAFFLMLLRATPQRDGGRPGDPLAGLFTHRDPAVRAVAAELARHRPDAGPYLGPLVRALSDRDPAVQAAARASLVAIAGTDVGGESDAARERWRAWVEGRGAGAAPGP